jgi:hypothetical protein
VHILGGRAAVEFVEGRQENVEQVLSPSSAPPLAAMAAAIERPMATAAGLSSGRESSMVVDAASMPDPTRAGKVDGLADANAIAASRIKALDVRVAGSSEMRSAMAKTPADTVSPRSPSPRAASSGQ